MRIGPLTTKGRKHGHRCTHDRHYTGSLRTQEGPLPKVWQTRPSQTEVATAQGPHGRLQGHRLSGAHLRRVSGPVRLLYDVPQYPEGVLPRALYDNKVRDLV